MAGDGTRLIGLWFDGQTHFASGLRAGEVVADAQLPVFEQVRDWLDCYFASRVPAFMPPVRTAGTAFQEAVWQILRQIPYGTTVTYAGVARLVARRLGVPRMSAQAVGGAVGRNPVSIIIPCHRVVGSDGSLTGYAGGIELKRALLQLEGNKMIL